MKIREFEMWCQEMDSRLKEANDKGVPLIIEDLNRKGIDLSKDISYIQSNKNKTVMIDKDREEFNYKLEMLFDEYHYSIYLIDDIWEMKDKIKAKVKAFKKD